MALVEKVSVKEFYENSEIFITGGTGFIGKVMVEKLLRSCGNIKTIHLLMRVKKGVTVSERIKQITDDVVSKAKRILSANELKSLEFQPIIIETSLSVCIKALRPTQSTKFGRPQKNQHHRRRLFGNSTWN